MSQVNISSSLSVHLSVTLFLSLYIYIYAYVHVCVCVCVCVCVKKILPYTTNRYFHWVNISKWKPRNVLQHLCQCSFRLNQRILDSNPRVYNTYCEWFRFSLDSFLPLVLCQTLRRLVSVYYACKNNHILRKIILKKDIWVTNSNINEIK